MAYLGVADKKAQQELAQKEVVKQSRSQLIAGGGKAELRIDDDFARSWRVVGLTLDRVGFAVEDRDRSAGIYYVRYNDPSKEDADKGWLSKLAFWSDDENIDKVNRYQVRVASRDNRTVVSVANDKGEADASPTAIRILTLLQEQIR
jgi:outer membrane protein assembly factor BamC